MLHSCNPFVGQFKQAIRTIKENNKNLVDYEIRISTDGKVDHSCYNCPTGHGVHELAGFMPGSENDVIAEKRDIRLEAIGDQKTCLVTLYHDFPRIARWIDKERKWKERQRSEYAPYKYIYKRGNYPPVGRMNFVQPNEGERYYLRQLLLHVHGATSFDDLKTTYDQAKNPPKVIHSTFKEACRERGLLQDDMEWVKCMDEAATFASPTQL